MNERIEIATAAMAAILSNPVIMEQLEVVAIDTQVNIDDVVAAAAYRMADAMIKRI